MTFQPEESIDADLVCLVCEHRQPTTAHVNEYGTIAVSSGLCPECDDTEPMVVQVHRTPELPAESYFERLIREARDELARPKPLTAAQSRARNRQLRRYLDRLYRVRNLVSEARNILEGARHELGE